MKPETKILFDVLTSAVFFIIHFWMILNIEKYMNNAIFDEMTILIALAAWFFLARAVYLKFKLKN